MVNILWIWSWTSSGSRKASVGSLWRLCDDTEVSSGVSSLRISDWCTFHCFYRNKFLRTLNADADSESVSPLPCERRVFGDVEGFVFLDGTVIGGHIILFGNFSINQSSCIVRPWTVSIIFNWPFHVFWIFTGRPFLTAIRWSCWAVQRRFCTAWGSGDVRILLWWGRFIRICLIIIIIQTRNEILGGWVSDDFCGTLLYLITFRACWRDLENLLIFCVEAEGKCLL